MTEHDQEKWVELYKAALLELKQSLMAGRIAEAGAEILKRIEALRDIPGLHDEERQPSRMRSTTFSFWSAKTRR